MSLIAKKTVKIEEIMKSELSLLLIFSKFNGILAVCPIL